MKRWLVLVAILGTAGAGMAAQMGDPEGDYGNEADANGSTDTTYGNDVSDVETIPYDTDWSSGPDLLAMLDRQRANGAEPFIVQRAGLVSLKGFGNAPFPAIPSDWRQVHQVAAVETPAGLRQYEVIFLSPHYAMVGVHPAWRVGGAVCMRYTGEVRLYALGGEAFPSEEQMHRRFLDANTATVRSVVSCTAARETAPGEVSIREYGEDGQRFDPMEETTIAIETPPSIAALRPAPDQ